MTIYKIDSWDCEGFEISANNNIILRKYLADQDGTENLCKNPKFNDLPFYFEQEMSIPDSELNIKFQNHLDQDLDDGIYIKYDKNYGVLEISHQKFNSLCKFLWRMQFLRRNILNVQGDKTQIQSKIRFEIKSMKINNNIIVILKGSQYQVGITQQYTTSQTCLNSYKFPKIEQQE